MKNGSNPNTQYNRVLLEKSDGIVSPSTKSTQGGWTGQRIGRDDAPAYSNATDGKSYYGATMCHGGAGETSWTNIKSLIAANGTNSSLFE